jgi:hypothetical protein
MGNCTAYAKGSDISPADDMKAFDSLPRELRQALANSNHDWAASPDAADLAKGESVNALLKTLIRADHRQAWLYEWGMERGFPPSWAKRASAAYARSKRKRR